CLSLVAPGVPFVDAAFLMGRGPRGHGIGVAGERRNQMRKAAASYRTWRRHDFKRRRRRRWWGRTAGQLFGRARRRASNRAFPREPDVQQVFPVVLSLPETVDLTFDGVQFLRCLGGARTQAQGVAAHVLLAKEGIQGGDLMPDG